MKIYLITLVFIASCVNYNTTLDNYGDVDASYIFSPRLSETQYVNFTDPLKYYGAIRPYLKEEVYTKYEDIFDFIAVFIQVREGIEQRSAGSFSHVVNNVRNIGLGNNETVGISKANAIGANKHILQGIIRLPSTHIYKSAFLHELGHRWGAYTTHTARKYFEDNEDPLFEHVFSSGHWQSSGGSRVSPSLGEGTVWGQLGGFHQESMQSCTGLDPPCGFTSLPLFKKDAAGVVLRNADGTPQSCNDIVTLIGQLTPLPNCFLKPEGLFTMDGYLRHTGGPRAIYNDRELYLMGLIPSSELKTFSWMVRTPAERYKNSLLIEIYSPKKIEIEPTKFLRLLSHNGVTALERDPPAASSQKHFKILVMLIQDPKNPLEQSKLDEIVEQLKLMETRGSDNTDNTNFWEATGGRASIKFSGLGNLK